MSCLGDVGMSSAQAVGDGDLIYLDYHATTPCDPRVADVVSECLTATFGNPSSPHTAGKSAEARLAEARKSVAEHINARSGEIIFTSGATESNNTAIIGLAKGVGGRHGRQRRILTSEIEHKSVQKAATSATDYGFIHETIPVNSDGYVEPATVADLVDDRTFLVSVQAANNEIGTVQPIGEIAGRVKEVGAYFHCDAAQALGRLDVDVCRWGADLVSFSAHKAYGPKGIGALYIDGGPRSLPVAPLLQGGGQEKGMRPGTVNVPNAAGFATACQIIDNNLEQEKKRIASLRDTIEEIILSTVKGTTVIGGRDERLVSTTNIHFDGVEAEALLARAPNVALSTGSACESGAPEPSHVLEAVGLDREQAYECVRFAVGRFTTEEEIRQAASIVRKAVLGIRAVS